MSEEDVALDQPETDEAEGTEENEAQEPELSKDEKFKARLKDAVQFRREELGPMRLKLTVTVPREVVDERLGEEFQELKRDAIIPGFRKGHAPLKLVEKRFATDVGDQIKVQLFANGYLAAAEKAELKTLGDPLFHVKVKEERAGEDRLTRAVETDKLLPLDKALDSLFLPKEGDLSFVCEVELKPQFDLPNLDKIPVRRPRVGITEADVDQEIRRMRLSRATFEPVEGGPVELDDLLYADVKLSVDGQVVYSEENLELRARDFRHWGVPLAGFGETVKGSRQGQTVMLEATVPEDHEELGLRGKPAHCEVMVREIKRLHLPPVDERMLEWAGCETEEELRNRVRETMESALDDIIQRASRTQISEYLSQNTALEIPEGLSQRQTDRAIARRLMQMYADNTPQPEIDKAMDEMRSKAHEQVQHDLKLYFILEKIAEDWEVEVEEEEINSAIANMARRSNMRFDRVRDELIKRDGLSSIYVFMRDQKVLDTLLERAEVTEVEGPAPSEAT